MIATQMEDKDWLNWQAIVKCPWLTCYAGLGLAGNGNCFAGGDYKNKDCPEYKNEDLWIETQEAKR